MRAKDGKLIPLDPVGLAQTSPTLGVKRAIRTMVKPRKPKDEGKGCRGWCYSLLEAQRNRPNDPEDRQPSTDLFLITNQVN